MGLSRHLLLSSSPGATSMTCSTALLISGATPEKGAVAGQCVCQCVRASLLLQHNNMGVRKMKLIITTLHTTLGRRGLHGVHNTLGVPDKDQADRKRWRWRWGYPVCVCATDCRGLFSCCSHTPPATCLLLPSVALVPSSFYPD